MLITENAIRRIIEEEIEKLVQEGRMDEVSWKDLKQRAKMAGLGAAGMISALGIHSGDSRAPEQAYDNQPAVISTAPSTPRPKVKQQIKIKSNSLKAVKKDDIKEPSKINTQIVGLSGQYFPQNLRNGIKENTMQNFIEIIEKRKDLMPELEPAFKNIGKSWKHSQIKNGDVFFRNGISNELNINL